MCSLPFFLSQINKSLKRNKNKNKTLNPIGRNCYLFIFKV
ncbi:unnamed protein product [Nyctereutes procyonoides]|uniref:(raccoon dog) hypothetical protein n=1 Tax=Nyctereutes procyonoides TaxID=34880 RepID=A0A811ZLR4_NYCPR|nr:unnamed protein product [Nyctereutes procyonoides]